MKQTYPGKETIKRVMKVMMMEVKLEGMSLHHESHACCLVRKSVSKRKKIPFQDQEVHSRAGPKLNEVCQIISLSCY